MNPEERAAVNKRQREFYDSKHKNLPTRIWSFFRNGLLNKIKKQLQVERDIYELHKKWFGDLSNKKVLDLGCYKGNSLSFYLASNSKSYLGIDLSATGITYLEKRLKNIPTARAEVVDFLSKDFKEGDFDLIYAYGVLHHFKDVDELIAQLDKKLAVGGVIISYDPLQTSIPMKFFRMLYRPFQSDKDWEWPFSKKTFFKFQENFEVKERRGVLAKAKYASLLNFMPVSEEYKEKKAKKWHRSDWEKSSQSDTYLFRCMHLSMLLQKKSL
ncbi:class I SAM-dependent methyltransferase [Salinimicrobium soli]|uniref:class I SAM-dependent methyltransferase n=1 Tax=Salinimicrobium soli TaxID=1254399 RepID=UPI003AAFC7A3